MFSRFDTRSECDGETDGPTEYQHRAGIQRE